MDAKTRTDKIARAYSRLVALRKNTPNRYYVDEEHVRQYHEALQHLEDAGYDIAEFTIPQQWLQHRVTSSGPYGTHYAKIREAETSKFLSKLDAILEYFSLTTSGSEGAPHKVIGFTGQER